MDKVFWPHALRSQHQPGCAGENRLKFIAGSPFFSSSTPVLSWTFSLSKFT